MADQMSGVSGVTLNTPLAQPLPVSQRLNPSFRLKCKSELFQLKETCTH